MNTAVQIMDAVRLGKGNFSKKDIREYTTAAWGTMCKVVDNLVDLGYIFARREKVQKRGRPTIPLCINGDAAFYIGIDVGAGHTRTVVCNLAFNTVYMDEVETPHYSGEQSFFAFIKERIDEALVCSRIERDKLSGIGLGISGNVDFENGIIVSGGNFGMEFGANLHVADFLENIYGVNIYAVTTQAAASAAEYHFGGFAGTKNILTVGCGVGIGSGVVSDGTVMISRPGRLVGHIGHTLVSGNRRICSCGFRGCLESYTGAKNLVEVARERFPGRVDFDSAHSLDRLAALGDKDAVEIMDTAAALNAAGIANMMQLYAPEAIVFGGGQCKKDGYLYLKMIEEIRSIIPPERREHIQYAISNLGKYQSAIGAARLVFEKTFFGK